MARKRKTELIPVDSGTPEESAGNGLNERCPLQTRCEQRCAYQGHEADCPYYAKFADDDYHIEGQETRRNDGHECVTGWNPSGICGAASYCTENRDCCMGCPNPCNIHCGLVTEHENAQVGDVSPAQDADAVSLPIEMIPIDLLSPHPDNPRKDLGDLTELSASIKANGVLQNLTVVPDESALDAPRFLVIIGHRRLAAAKLAEMTELPCVIADRMTPLEQVRTMLEENMQRSDLTVYEQAQGFQMMLDMGDTVESVSKDSGFSVTTIRRRLKLLELDADKFKASEERGATLSDYMELDKIESPELKNKVLDKIGTPDFKNALKSAVESEKNQKIINRWATEAGAFATRVEEIDYSTMKHVRTYSIYGNKKDSVECPDDAGETAYYFKIDHNSLTLYRVKGDTEQAEETAAEAEREAMREASMARESKLTEMTKRHFELRKEFVSEAHPREYAYVMRYASSVLIGDGTWRRGPDMALLTELLGVDEPDDNEDFATLKKRLLPDVNDTTRKKEARLLLFAAYARMDSDRNGYWVRRWDSANGGERHERAANPELDELYEFLTTLGYEMSEEEKQMRDGTHPLIAPKPTEDNDSDSNCDA